MSWMDSWSRPSKHSAIPPPFYLTSGDEVQYCLSCGRVIGSKKSSQKQNSVVKYCSSRCRHRKIGHVDEMIEKAIVALLDNSEESGIENTAAKAKMVKGDHRVIITMDEIEEIVFGNRFDPTKTFGRKKNRASRVISVADNESKAVCLEETEDSSDTTLENAVEERTVSEPRLVKLGPRVRPPQTESEVNFSVGGERGKAEKITESAEDSEKRREGDRKAEERELVRRAARRGVVFGFVVDDQATQQEPIPRKAKGRSSRDRPENNMTDRQDAVVRPVRKKCEALMNGVVVEPSFAKGNWSIRWREQI